VALCDAGSGVRAGANAPASGGQRLAAAPMADTLQPPSKDSGPDAKNMRTLVAKAEQMLYQRERAAVQDDEGAGAKRERIKAVLLTAMEIAEEDDSAESTLELERAIKAAQIVGVAPSLRVKARKLLSEQEVERKRVKSMEVELERLVRQADKASEALAISSAKLAELSAANAEKDEDDDEKEACAPRTRFAREVHQHRQKLQACLNQLQQAVDEAQRQEFAHDSVDQALALIQRVKAQRRSEDKVAMRLRNLMSLEDPEQLETKLQLARQRIEGKGPGVQKVVMELEGRIGKLMKKEMHERWLDHEIAVACEALDVQRLHQLQLQAKSISLAMPPHALSLLHGLEEMAANEAAIAGNAAAGNAPTGTSASSGGASSSSLAQRSEDYAAKIREQAERRTVRAEVVIDKAEMNPNLRTLDLARQAISDAKITKVPADAVVQMERRLTRLEEEHGPRLHAEEELLKILRSPDLITFENADGSEGTVIQDLVKVGHLKSVLEEAHRAGVSDDIFAAAEELLERCVALETQQRAAAEHLRAAMNKPLRTEEELEELHTAIDEGRRCHIPTLHAKKVLTKLRDAQVHREAAEAELREARKGQGAQGRMRLEAAIQAAKTAGVSSRKLRAAIERMEELKTHEQKCALLAGNIRRILPLLESEPWRYQQLKEASKDLMPWTPELEKMISEGQQKLDKTLSAQARQKEIQAELQALLKRISTGRSNGQSCADEMFVLSQLLARAKEASLKSEVQREAEEVLRTLRREGCQRNVAQHRLRLALNAKDFNEIERSLREVRALGQSTLVENPATGRSDRDRSEPPHSARLIDAATSMMRHLGDVAARRQQAETALLQRIADSDVDHLPHLGGSTGAEEASGTYGSGYASGTAQQGTDAWVKEVMEVLHEAKQSGVPQSLIDHARMKIRQKRRERQEENEAVNNLRKALARKDTSTQEILRNVRKVERYQRAVKSAR